MLKITVELLPGGHAEFRRTLGLMHIGNVSNLKDRSDYEIRLTESANPLAGTPPRQCAIRLRDHDRRQSVWSLVGAAIREVESNGKFVDT
jgi:hypothetical protein